MFLYMFIVFKKIFFHKIKPKHINNFVEKRKICENSKLK